MSRTRFLILALIGILLPIATIPQVRLNIVSAWERPEVQQQQLDRWLLRGANGTEAPKELSAEFAFGRITNGLVG
jgi:hypothetical protein